MERTSRLATLISSILIIHGTRSYAYEVGDVAVVSPTNAQFEGILEMYLSTLEWSTFCISSFDKKVANLSCRQLGYPQAYKYGTIIELGYDKTVEKRKQCISSVKCPEDANNMKSCSYFTTVEFDKESMVALICNNTRSKPNTYTREQDPSAKTTDSLEYNHNSLLKVIWAIAFGAVAFVLGCMLIFAISVVLWHKKKSPIVMKKHISRDDSATLVEDDRKMCQSNTYSSNTTFFLDL